MRRIQIITTNDLSLTDDLLGPFNKQENAVNWDIVARSLEELCTEQPRLYATFPAAEQRSEK